MARRTGSIEEFEFRTIGNYDQGVSSFRQFINPYFPFVLGGQKGSGISISMMM